jgi:hypothetical protein
MQEDMEVLLQLKKLIQKLGMEQLGQKLII